MNEGLVEEIIGEEVPEYTIDIEQLNITNRLNNVTQEGNYIVGVSATGVKFRQRIPQGKILNKDDKGNWILKDMELRETADAL